ncbi:MAG TPA: NAD-dependent epimerase/dehydratase family protein [Gammaproteobacteria bacterium]|nr:NAD-dependent epimerase/dehydratase family protein [Gammaproteobacteria bacterium]
MTVLDRILVTGGAGFIGSHTVDFLLRQGKQIIVLDNLFSSKLNRLDLQHPNLEFIEGDVLEYPLVVDLLESCDAVLHLAAIASVQYSIEHLIYSFQVNTQGFLHVLEAIRQANRPIRLVYASSAAVYGHTQQMPCCDSTPLLGELLSPYALQKVNNEEYAKLYARLHGVNSLALRYFNVYGLGQDPQSPYSGVINRFIDAYHQDAELVIFGDGKQSRDFIHVRDVVEANCLALQSQYSGVLNIATGQPQTILDLTNYLKIVGRRTAKLQFNPAKLGDIRVSYADIRLAKQALGFHYKITLQEGMKMMFEKYRGVD